MDRRGKLNATCVALLLLAVTPSGVARAELLRCTGADGKTIYTDDKSLCPDAKPFQPSAVLHGTERQTPAEPAARSRRAEVPGASAAAAEAGSEQHWRDLRAAKQDELARIGAEREELASYVAWCNRGGSVIGRDESGIKRQIDCDQLRGKMESLETRKAELDAYLEEGLAEDCRRAGCEPGWIR